MYEIILKTWYPETQNYNNYEVYHGLEFIDIKQAINYLNDNIETILDEFPIDGEITIKYKI